MCQKRTRPCSPGAARAPRHLLLLARRSAPGQTPAALGATRTRQVCSAQPQSWFCLLNLKRRAGRSRCRAGGGGDPGRHACGAPSPRTATRRARDGPPRRRGWTERPCRRAPSPHVARLRPVGQVPPVGRVVFPADVLGVVPQGAHLRGTAGLSRVTQRQEGAVQTSRAQYKCPAPIGAHAASKDTGPGARPPEPDTRPHVGPPRPRRGTRVPPDARMGTETHVAGRASPVVLQRRQARRLRQGGAPRETGEITADRPRLGPRGGPASPVRPCCRCATGHSAGARPCPWWS